jgi:hypothetical protein
MASPMHVIPTIGESGLKLAWDPDDSRQMESSQMAWAGKMARAQSTPAPIVTAQQAPIRLGASRAPAKPTAMPVAAGPRPSLASQGLSWDIHAQVIQGLALPDCDFSPLLDPTVMAESDVMKTFRAPPHHLRDCMPGDPGFGPPPPGPRWFADAGPMFGPPPPPPHGLRGPGFGLGPGFGPPPHPPMF